MFLQINRTIYWNVSGISTVNSTQFAETLVRLVYQCGLVLGKPLGNLSSKVAKLNNCITKIEKTKIEVGSPQVNWGLVNRQ